MSKFVSAEMISKKIRAFKHCNKLLEEIDKCGEVKIVLNCTGVEFIVHKDDAIYLQIQTRRAQYAEDIGSYEIIKKASSDYRNDIPSLPKATELKHLEEDKDRIKKERQKEYNRRYNAKKKAEKDKMIL